jgi:hypothetical protein
VMLAALEEQNRQALADHLAACARALHPEPDPEHAADLP